MLAGGVHKHTTVLQRLDHRHLSLQIKVLLTTHVDLTLETVRCRGQRLVRVAALLGMTGAHKEGCIQGFLRTEHRMQWLILDLGQSRRLTGSGMAGRRHGKDRLTNMLDQLTGQDRVAGENRADIGMAGHIGEGDHRHHTGIGAYRAQIHAGDTRVRLFAVADRRVQQTFRLTQIIDIACLTTHV